MICGDRTIAHDLRIVQGSETQQEQETQQGGGEVKGFALQGIEIHPPQKMPAKIAQDQTAAIIVHYPSRV